MYYNLDETLGKYDDAHGTNDLRRPYIMRFLTQGHASGSLWDGGRSARRTYTREECCCNNQCYDGVWRGDWYVCCAGGGTCMGMMNRVQAAPLPVLVTTHTSHRRSSFATDKQVVRWQPPLLCAPCPFTMQQILNMLKPMEHALLPVWRGDMTLPHRVAGAKAHKKRIVYGRFKEQSNVRSALKLFNLCG